MPRERGGDTQQALTKRAQEFRAESTTAEAHLWRALRRRRLSGRHFRRQHVLDRFIVDFFCRAEGLIVEVDGPIHIGQQGRDKERQTILESMGFRVLRFSNAQVLEDVDGVVLAISETFRDG